MTIRDALFVLLACSLPVDLRSASSTARQAAELPADKVDSFLALVEEIRARTATPGASLALVVDHQLVHLGGLGFQDVASATPATEHTLFAIGSCTKAFTGVLAAKLAARGKLDWHDPVRQHIPELRMREAYLTEHLSLHDLFTHVSGLAPYNLLWYGAPLQRADLVPALLELHSFGSLRRGYIYNNILYAVAGTALERASGASWNELIETEVFEPLGMSQLDDDL